MKVNGERIKQAREARGLTQEELARRVGASQPLISLIEQNAQVPSERLLESIALATGFTTGFFLRSSGLDFPLGSLLYRKSRKISAADTAAIRQVGRLALEVLLHLGKRFKQLPVDLPRLSADPEQAAQLVRSQLSVSPDGPLVGLFRKLERIGIIVLYLPCEVEGFDAFSAWLDVGYRKPVIFLKKGPGDRGRRTLAHELGHLVLHREFLGSPKELDSEANKFAAELLFPRETMMREITPPLTITRLADLKKRWGVSMQAIAYDAAERGIISARQKGYIRRKLVGRGWLQEEPVQIPVELPRLFSQMLEATFTNHQQAVRHLSRETGVSTALIEALIHANTPRDTVSAQGSKEAGATVLTFASRL